MRPIENVAIVGFGSLGAMYAGCFGAAMGPERVFVVADTARTERYRAEAATFNGEPIRVTYLTYDEAAERAAEEPFNVVLYAVKYGALPEAIEQSAPLIGPDTAIISVLNGVTSEEVLAERFGWDRVLLCVAQQMDSRKVGATVTAGCVGVLALGVHDAEDAAKTAERAASAARQDALSAAQSNQAAAVARDEAMQSSVEAAQSAAASKADADRTEGYAGRVEEEIRHVALDILTPQVVTEAVAKATEKATESAGLAQMHAEDAQFAANDARNTTVICKNNADRAVEAKDACEDLAARFLHDYQVESATVELSAQMVRLADRVTRVELDHINIPHGGDGNPSPGGYELAPGVRVVPLTVVDDAVNAPVTGAALTAVVDDF